MDLGGHVAGLDRVERRLADFVDRLARLSPDELKQVLASLPDWNSAATTFREFLGAWSANQKGWLRVSKALIGAQQRINELILDQEFRMRLEASGKGWSEDHLALVLHVAAESLLFETNADTRVVIERAYKPLEAVIPWRSLGSVSRQNL